MHNLRVFVGISVLTMLATSAFGQVATARLEGSVQDQTGAVVPGAKITAVNVHTQHTVEQVSDSAGNYTFPSLQPGTYNLSTEASGFRKTVIEKIELNVSAVVSQIIKLEVGQTSESVEVTANTVSVQTTDSQISRAVTMRDIDTLPQLGRTPISLAAFQPGVQINPADSTFSHVNGNRQGSNNATLDGIDVNDSLVPRLGLALTSNNTDSIGEFRIVTAAGKAEYGRSSGGQIELITRSGTNAFHGNAFDFLRNTATNANDFFNNQSGGTVPKFIQNIYGASLGGPIIHNKTFFFANWQGTRARTETVRNRTVLTPTAKQGIFRWKAADGSIQTYNIVANDPRHLGIDPTMLKNSISLLPEPNNIDLGDGLNTAGFRFNNPTPSSNDQATAKIDHNLTANHRLFFRWSDQHNSSIDNLNNADATFPGQPQGAQGGHRWGYSIGSDWNLTPMTVNEFRTGYQSSSVAFERPGRPAGPAYVSNDYFDPINAAFAQGRNSPVREYTDNITHVWKSHTFKGGVNIRRTLQTGYNDAGIFPNVSFSRTANGNTVPAAIGPQGLSSTDRTRFENLYNEVLGRVDQIATTFYSNLKTFQPAGTTRQRDYTLFEQGYFVQDDWKIRRNLTFNLGLRWDIYGSPHEKNGLQGTLDQAAAVNSVNTLSNLTVKPGASFYPTDLNNFAPRFGFAWDVFGDGRTAIRGNYGIFYDRNVGATINQVDSLTPGFSAGLTTWPNLNGTDVRLSDNPAGPVPPASPVVTLPATRSQSAAIFNPSLRSGYVQQYGLSIQREIIRNTVLEVGYVGERGVKLFLQLDYDQPKINGTFLNDFKELQAFNAKTVASVAPSNVFVRLFGSAANAVSKIGSVNLTQGNVGTAASTVDRNNFSLYPQAGLSDYFLRNYPQYNLLEYGTNDGRLYYDALQISLRRQTGLLRVGVNYTYSHSLDNITAEGNGYTAVIDSYNLKLNKARGDFDRPHSLNGSFIFTPPVGRGKKLGGDMPRWADSLIGGWDIGATFVVQSGTPFTVSSQRTTTAVSNVGNTWANYSGDRNAGYLQFRGDGVYFFTPEEANQFSFPAAGEVGNSGRNGFRGPLFTNLDMSLVKHFKLTENQAVTFRAEGYNVFNHPTFGAPGVNLNTPSTFGKFSSTLTGARTMQFALRYDF